MDKLDTEKNKFPRLKINVDLEDKEYEKIRYAREVAVETLKHRREKAWRIFSWASSILLATTGGVIAILGKKSFEYSFFPLGLVLLIAILILSIYSRFWINQNLHLAKNAGKIVEHYNRHLGIDDGYEENKIKIDYVKTVIILTIAGILVILFTANWPKIGT